MQFSDFLHPNIPLFITTFGYIGLCAIVFAESGLFSASFSPATVCFFRRPHRFAGIFDIRVLATLIVVSAIAGDSVGYWFGAKVMKIFTKEDSFFFNKRHIERTRLFI